MFADLLTPELMALTVAVIVTAPISGFLAGLFGIGGGAIIVPFLYQAFTEIGVAEEVRAHLAIGTSLGIVVPTSIRSLQSHLKTGAVDRVLLKKWILPVLVGVLLASLLAAYLSSAGLRAVFATIALLVALRLIFNRKTWRLGSNLPGGPLLYGSGGLIGFLSTLMGIGGGVLNNTFMTLFGRPMHQAVATSAGVGILISVPGAIGYMIAGLNAEGLPSGSIGYVNFIGVAVFIPLTMLFAPYGVKVAHKASRRTLELLFGSFLLIVSARFFYSLLG